MPAFSTGPGNSFSLILGSSASEGRLHAILSRSSAIPALYLPTLVHRRAKRRVELFLFNVILAAIVSAGVHSTRQPMNARCANSQFTTGDIIPTRGGSSVITQISTVTNGSGDVVGWVFRTANGGLYGQANRLMPAEDLARVDQPHISRRVSGLFALHDDAWPDLGIRSCRTSEMRLGKYTPWRPQELPR